MIQQSLQMNFKRINMQSCKQFDNTQDISILLCCKVRKYMGKKGDNFWGKVYITSNESITIDRSIERVKH